MALLIENTLILREIFFYSSLATVIGPYLLYHIYTIWTVFDAILAPYGTYTYSYSFNKILSWIIYCGIAIFFETQVIPGIYNYYTELWIR